MNKSLTWGRTMLNHLNMKRSFFLALFAGVFVFVGAFSKTARAMSLRQRAAAATETANRQPLCRDIAPFYWEIGDRSHVLASGSVGDVTRTTTFPIASASKWVFASYVVQRLKGHLDNSTKKFLRMMSGYTNMKVFSCIFAPTIGRCENVGLNSEYTKSNDDKFYYNGGHFQKLAVKLGLGQLGRRGIVREYQKYLGSDFKIRFGAMQLAGGIQTSAKIYARFLRKILTGQLLMRRFLGVDATCTLPLKCTQAVYSPIPVAWHYSFGHWVEDDPQGDGSFSSPGAFGFYPWINASKTQYGIISRHHRRGRDEIGPGYSSAKRGRPIRKAYATGVAQI